MKGRSKEFWKRTVSGIFAAITLFSAVAITSALAASKTVSISFAHCYDSSGNPITYAADLVLDGTVAHEAGHERYKILGDEEEAYCIQPGVSLHTGSELTESASDTWKALSTTQKNAVKLALTYGKPGNSSNLSGTDGEQYVATQVIVWELVTGSRNDTGTYKRVDNTFYKSFFSDEKNSNVLKVYKEIEASMAAYNTIPSFMASSKSGADTYNLEWNGTNYSLTLTDSNKCLSNYSFTTSDSSVKASVSGNKLTLTSSKQVVSGVTITATGKLPSLSSDSKLVAYGDESLQDVIIGVSLPSTVKAYATVKTSVGDVKIVKTSEDGKVSGVKFHISGNGVEKDVTTASDGTITVENLTTGTYTVTEDADDIYETPAEQTVTVASGKTATVTFSNVLKRGSLEVTKTSEDGVVEGITFHLSGTSKSGSAVDEYAVTNAKGVATFKNILISDSKGYTLEEVNTKEYYIVPSAQKAVIEWNTVTKKTVTNKLKRGSLEVTKSSEDGSNSGIQFVVYGTSLSGAAVKEYATTDKNGVATFKNLPISDSNGYTLEEIDTKEYYIVPGAQKAVIEWNTVTKKTVTNKLKRGSLKVTKTSEDGLNSGIQFVLYGTSLSGAAVKEYATTDESGVATFKDILISNCKGYTLEEVDTAVKYVIPDSQTRSVNWNEVTKTTVTNILKKFRVHVTKSDVETGTAQGDATLAGAVYGIYNDGELVDTYTTDSNGEFTTSYYVCGDNWTIREITPSAGYLLDETVHAVGASAKDYTVELNITSNAVTEQVKKGNIQIVKHTDEEDPDVNYETDTETEDNSGVDLDNSGVIEKAEEAAVFEVYLKSAGSYDNAKDSERDILTTDENGYAKTKDLPYGTYVVHQVEGADGKAFVKDFSVFISENGKTYYFILNNTSITSRIRVEKRDAETGNLIAASGIGFQIYDANGNKVTQDIYYPTPMVLDTFYTNEEGWLMLPEVLSYGSYSLVEVQTAYGYVLDSEPVAFTVDGSENVVTVAKYNIAQKGTITVTKSGESFSSVTESGLPILDKNGISGDDATVYTPIYEVKGLAGAVYEVTAAEDIYTLDGTLRAGAGEVVATITTDENGEAVTDLLYLGKYTVTEVTAPYGMVLNSEPVTVELAYAGQEVEVTETAASFYNERQKVSMSVEKMLEVDETFGVGNRGEIQNVAFALYAAEELTAGDGSVIPKDGLLEVKFVNKKGQITFNADLPLGSYYVKEFATDCHYLISDTIYPVAFTYAGQETSLVTVTANDGEAIENKLIRGRVEGLKLTTSEEPLEGALFGLFRINADIYTEENAILTATSDAEGRFVFENIPYGNYVVRELAAPESYAVNTDNYYVSITGNGQTIGIKVLDEKITGALEITKTDVATGALIPSCGFEVLDADMNVIVQGYTDENGKAVFPDLEYGEYFYREYNAPEGYVIDEEAYPFAIRENHEVVKAEMTNRKITGSLELTKKDVADGELIPNCGVEILDKDGNVIVQGKTDENGVIVFDGLEYGEYFYREYNAPEGYVIDETAYPFSIKEDGQIVKAEMTNRKIQGTLELTKTDVATGELIPNCGVEILDKDGNVIVQGKTDKNGVIVFDGLEYGEYFYREYNAPKGYVIDETAYPFSIKEDGQIVKAEMTNRKITGSLELTKTDVATGELIPNCGVEILDKDGNVIVQGKTDKNGVIVFDSLEYGEYFYREYNAPKGYVIDETAYPFSITEDGQIVKAEMTNRKITGTLELTKKDVATGELLPNAKFRIYDEDGNVVAEGVTDENGLAVFALTYGKYTYQEYEAPEGYEIDETCFPFEIKKDGEIVKAEMTNTAIEDEPECPGEGDNTSNTTTTITDIPKTGDNTPLGLYLGLLGLSVAGTGAALYVSRKKKRNS